MTPPKIRGLPRPRNARNRTGCAGIAFVTTASNRRDGTVQHFYSVHRRRADGRPSNRKFCLETLGRAEAWRRALRCRAEHEAQTAARAARATRTAGLTTTPAPIAETPSQCNAGGAR